SALALGTTVSAHARSEAIKGRAPGIKLGAPGKFQGLKGLLAQADVPGLGDEKPAGEKPAASKPTNVYIITRQDGTKVQGKLRDQRDVLIVETADGQKIEVPKADIQAMRP